MHPQLFSHGDKEGEELFKRYSLLIGSTFLSFINGRRTPIGMTYFTAKESLRRACEEYGAPATDLNVFSDLFVDFLPFASPRRGVVYNPKAQRLTSLPMGFERFWKKVTPLEVGDDLEKRVGKYVTLNGLSINDLQFVDSYPLPLDRKADFQDNEVFDHSMQLVDPYALMQTHYGSQRIEARYLVSKGCPQPEKLGEWSNKDVFVIGRVTRERGERVSHLDITLLREAYQTILR